MKYRIQLQPNILKRPLAHTMLDRITKVGVVVKLISLKQNLVSQGSGFAGGNGSNGRQATHGTFVFTDTAANTFL
jgi:hypothetical protein